MTIKVSPENSNDSEMRHLLNKVPEVTLWFWVIKILCTTVGETFADYLNETLGFGLTNTTVVMSAALVVAMVWQFRSRRYIPFVYWLNVEHHGVRDCARCDFLLVGEVGGNDVDSLDSHNPARSLLLAGDPVHVRARNCCRRLGV